MPPFGSVVMDAARYPGRTSELRNRALRVLGFLGSTVEGQAGNWHVSNPTPSALPTADGKEDHERNRDEAMEAASVLNEWAPIGPFEPADSQIGEQVRDGYLVTHAQVCDALDSHVIDCHDGRIGAEGDEP